MLGRPESHNNFLKRFLTLKVTGDAAPLRQGILETSRSSRQHRKVASGHVLTRRGDPTHADKQKMKRLTWDCQKDVAAYVTPQMRNCGGRAAPDANLPARRWSGEEGVGGDWHGWWPDDNDGDDATAEPPCLGQRDGLTQTKLRWH